MVDLKIEEGRNEYVDTKLNDKCNDAYGLMFSSIMFLGPLVGSKMYRNLGSNTTCDYIACIDFVAGIFMFIFNCGFTVFSENK